MSNDDAVRKLEEAKKEREKSYLLLKGQIQGVRLQKLSPQTKAFVGVYELILDAFQRTWDDLYRSAKAQIFANQRINNLAKKIEDLENDIIALRQTLDKMVQDR